MARRMPPATLLILALAAFHPTSAADESCEWLSQFIASVQPDETRVVKLHTIWGRDFDDTEEPALGAKRCDHGGYEPGRVVCAHLIEFGATEFSGNNAKTAIKCLSPLTRFPARAELSAISLSLVIGTDDRGSLVEIELQEDLELGGMVLSITAEGY